MLEKINNIKCHCCPQCSEEPVSESQRDISRRQFVSMGGVLLGGLTLPGFRTCPRKMDGKNYDPVRIVTHFESDYGAAPHVEVQLGAVTTNIAPDFKSKRWVGVKGIISEVPFRPICRTQFDIMYECSDKLLAERMPGFHWMTCYGDYRKEIGYALRRVGIHWDNLDEVTTKEMC